MREEGYFLHTFSPIVEFVGIFEIVHCIPAAFHIVLLNLSDSLPIDIKLYLAYVLLMNRAWC